MRACRMCLTKKDLNPLFGDLSAVRFTSKQLYLATGVQIRQNDKLPQVACKSCIKQINKTLEFHYISNKSNEYLRQILKKVKIKPEKINNLDLTDDESFDRYFENLNLNKVKIENDYFQDLENKQSDNSHFDNQKNYDKNNKNQPDNDNKYLDNEGSDNSHFDNQKTYDRNDKNQPDNDNKYLDNEGIDNNYYDNDRNSNIQSDNNPKSHKNLNNHNSQLDKCYSIDNKQYLNKKNTKEHVKKSKRHKTKQITSKTSKNKIKKKLIDKKFNTQDSFIDLSQEINIKIENFETDFGNSDISNNCNNKQEKAIKVKDICEENEYSNDADKLETAESKINTVKIARNICKQKRNKLMSLAVTPYQSDGLVQCRVCHEYVKVTSFVMHAKRHFAPEFTCEDCGKTFRSNAHMVYHQQRMHGREKRLACSLCDFRTVDRLKLKNHERGHSGERPFLCNECGSSFRMRTNIVQHMRTHFGVRNVQCELCANLFRSKSELANHKNKVHNKVTYLCYLCPQTYKGKRAVRRHLLNLHGIKEDQIMKIKSIKSKKFDEVPKT